jgi:hypothetical protein
MRKATWCALFCLLGLGCSAEGTPERSGSGTGGVGGTIFPAGGSGGAAGISGAGAVGGVGGIAPPTGGAGGTGGGGGGSAIVPITIDECGAGNPAGLDPAAVQAAKAGGPGAGKMLYPYSGTVFPRGMISPLLMWEGGAGDNVYVHIKSQAFEYFGCLKPTAAGQLQMPQAIWDTAGQQTFGANDPFHIELTTLSGGTAAGPMAFDVIIAQATMKGSIYYNSYSSALATGGGAVLRIPAGGEVEAFTNTECNGCHSLSADGSRLISQTLFTGGRSFAIAANQGPNPASVTMNIRTAYGALYPDGSRFLSTSVATEVARAQLSSANMDPIQLFDANSGTVIPSTGIPAGTLMPTFSPDGSLLTFTDYAANNGAGLVVMKFDAGSNTASDYKVLYMAPTERPSWPFVLPDNGGVVFARTSGQDFSGDGAGIAGIPGLGAHSELYLADMDTGTTTILAKAMGFDTPANAASGTTYLPFGAEDLGKNYFSTVSPVAAGGYFWVFFDAVRHYGNRGLQRQLWGAAVSISADGDYTTDRSHPAFYLPGQEFGTGNHRAFAALDACQEDGNDCTTGIDCCGGFCFIPEDAASEFGVPKGTCTSMPPMCARRDERCLNNDDCCDPEDPSEPHNTCIAGYCAYIPLE